MDLWAESKAKQVTEETKKYFEMENGNFALENGDATKKRKSKRTTQVPNERPSPNQRTKMSDERNVPAATRRSDQRHLDKRVQAETEEELEEDEEDFGGEYRGNKFYADNQEPQDRRGENDFETDKYAKLSSSSSVSDDESTITIPEPGRKVEHIAQKLEQTAQKYAREHSPPKFLDRRERSGMAEYKSLDREARQIIHARDRRERSAAEYKSLERGRDGGQKSFERDDKRPREDKRAREDKHTLERSCREDKQNLERAHARESKQNFERAREEKQNFERSREDKQNFERSREDKQGFQRPRDESHSYERARAARSDQERAYIEQRKEVQGYERTFEKNPNRTIERLSSRRFERPRPPSQEAPERPVGPYRERRYSDKEEAIYGEAGRYGVGSLERDRGYESNFETKLERSKVIERHGYQAGLNGPGPQKRSTNAHRTNERSNGDTNNNTLKVERKPLPPRQATAVDHGAQTGRVFEEPKSPKLVKRTKSFWKFRRDSEVLEGMALWQHRSLVDIPKMIRKEDKTMENEDKQRNSDGGSPNSSLGSEGTITNEHQHEEPKPAERSHVPDKTDYVFENLPTPAERPKITERSEYRMPQHSEERTYFMGNVSRKAIIEKERKRSLEAKRNMIVAELKENNESKRNDMMSRGRRNYDEEEDATLNFSETEASDEESTYSCIVVKDQSMPEKTLLPRTKLRRESDRDRNTCGPWYDLWGVDASVKKKKKQKQQ